MSSQSSAETLAEPCALWQDRQMTLLSKPGIVWLADTMGTRELWGSYQRLVIPEFGMSESNGWARLVV